MQNAEAGATVEFEKVLLVDKDGNITVGAPTVEGAKVVCEVVSGLVKGDKDGSVFGVNNKWGVFPAISGGWIISNEKFFKNWDQKWWNTLKIRASYGDR